MLVRALAVRAEIFGAADPEAAMSLYADAIRRFSPLFSRLPELHAGLMTAICKAYQAAAEATRIELDGTLLGPIVPVLAQIHRSRESSAK